MVYSDYSVRSKSNLYDAKGHYEGIPGTGVLTYGPNDSGTEFTEKGTLFSKGNPYQLLGKTVRDIGGAMVLEKCTYQVGPRIGGFKSIAPVTGGAKYLYTGAVPIWAGLLSTKSITNAVMTTNFSESGITSARTTLNSLGATAIARTTPTRSNASLGATLVELKRDGLPSIVGATALKNRCRDYKDVGGEYLNVEFGWKPFINDLKRSLRVSLDAHSEMDRYYAEAGRPIHRRYTFPTQQSSTVIYSNAYNAGLYVGGTYCWDEVYGDSTRGWRTVTDSSTVKQWFSGEFLYHAPRPSDNMVGHLQSARDKADYLYGVNVDPDTLWNIAPWTWLPDYFTNLGDVITNLSTFLTQGDVLRYGYIMQHTRNTRHIQADFPSNVLGNKSYFAMRHQDQKFRVSASPFGFGVNPSSLSERQWAILVALGLSKGKRSGGNFAM